MDGAAVCALCGRSEETEVTGSLLRDDAVTAHHSCLLYAAGIYCRDSPEFGDLGGFRVQDVQGEVIRGKKLTCHHCKKKGATVGCEVNRCQKSYHYPCAIEDGAKPISGEEEGKYGIHCFKHSQRVSNSSMKRHDSMSSSCSSTGGRSAKRPLSQTDISPAKRRVEDWFPDISEDSINTEDTEQNTDIDMYGPLESDVESENPEQQIYSDITEDPVVSPSGGQQEDESLGENTEEHTAMPCSEVDAGSDESQSLLLPVELVMDTQSTCSEYYEQSSISTQSCRLKQDSAGSALEDFSPVQSFDQCETPFKKERSRSPPYNFQKPDPPPSVPMCPPATPSFHPPCLVLTPSPPYSPEPNLTPSSFWKSCNAAGSTQAIFEDFFHEMSDVAERIRSDQASGDDYELALSVLAATGKLPAYVAKQQKELERKQQELEKASAAMMEVVTALRKIPSTAGSSTSAALRSSR